jgi:hypothetical protein
MVLAVVVELGEQVAHGVDPGPFLVIALDNDPRRDVGVRGAEHVLLGGGVSVPLVK